jgi:hypothetical protein
MDTRTTVLETLLKLLVEVGQLLAVILTVLERVQGQMAMH